MNLVFLVIVTCFLSTHCEKRILHTNKTDAKNIKSSINKSLDDTKILNGVDKKSSNKTVLNKHLPKIKIPTIPPTTEKPPLDILPDLVQKWAVHISDILYKHELIVRRDDLIKSFSGAEKHVRNGSAIVDKMAKSIEELLNKRVLAAEAIRRRAEDLARADAKPPKDYTFDRSINADLWKKELPTVAPRQARTMRCRGLRKLKLENQTHFGSDKLISLDVSSVHVAVEVFDCDPEVRKELFWSEGLLSTFRSNFVQDAMLDFQYFCSAKGFIRHYPGALWSSMFNLKLDFGESDDEEEEEGDVYDCRLRPWYVASGGAPRDILVLYDASGSMYNSSNLVHAELFTQTLLNALTDDDQVNVLMFNVVVESPIPCFNDKLVPFKFDDIMKRARTQHKTQEDEFRLIPQSNANNLNSAAMMAAVKQLRFDVKNETNVTRLLIESVMLLRQQQKAPDLPTSCQQAIVIVTDCVDRNYTDFMRALDPTGRIRLFIVWLHDPFGLRDKSHNLGEWLSCSSDGSFAEMVTDSDVTGQVMQILHVLERPLVAQRKERLTVFSDLYAHLEDPRRSDFYWKQKENVEQEHQYKVLRKGKKAFLDPERLRKRYMHENSLDSHGYYYEGQEIKYNLMISVSMPVFDYTTSENITKILVDQKGRKSTRTYPVNRLIGVAGVDIPVEHLKRILPYSELGPGGSLFIVDHRGSIVLHDNIKPVFDGDILKPGYRTVDMLDLEQSGVDHLPRNYSHDWLEFRRDLVVKTPRGSRVMYGKNVFEDGMRAIVEMREYHWRRILDHYTVVVVLPTKYGRQYAAHGGDFTQKLAESASEPVRSEHSVQPDWLYCRHIDPHFDEPEFEVRHFISRRKEEANFEMQKLEYLKHLKYTFSPLKNIPLMEKPYQCNGELMARFCMDAIVTAQWADNHVKHGVDLDCNNCELGSSTAFFATESGLTRWQQYYAIDGEDDLPSGDEWPRGPKEPFYQRAAASPDTLVVHAPVSPIRRMRNTFIKPPPLGPRYKWFTAARVLNHPDKGMIGVAGYHFNPKRLDLLLSTLTTNKPLQCPKDEICPAQCDGKYWKCVIVDEGGWMVSGHTRDENVTEEDPVREHLARLYPQAMFALLSAGVFKLDRIHDYQAVCFTKEDEGEDSSAVHVFEGSLLPSILRSLWYSTYLIFHVARELVTVLSILTSGGLVAAETRKEKEKSRRRLARDNAREKYETLFTHSVLVDRTTFAACDRFRPIYVLQRSRAVEAFKNPPLECTWPLVGALIPKTNLVLLAIKNRCPYEGPPLPDPLSNVKVDLESQNITSITRTEWQMMDRTSKLACWRNQQSLPVRAPHSTCYPHNFTEEKGYRQCGPWLPDPWKEGDDEDEEEYDEHDGIDHFYD